ncbi:uncharacterized protein I303_100948 [Kwoniella dejecticola CBS 10117]|uniref:Short-chain dehydrogenase n=1 Tax=Kwoniella dejecticola CBS 10117 TaxID=1296121 RepID=A0A1A6AGC7_9TREE|nr:uncharacterized protein I303_00952 [Kwoniella dejecticola CBS 10117]OBR89130.1 hypothetical protein I303_00952 [Kwoniella dejecticola CBS 10117]
MPNQSYPWSMYRGLWSILPPAPTGDYLRGKVVVITGANSGVGLEATKQLAGASPEQLILAVRAIDQGEKILKDLQKTYPAVKGRVVPLDLTDLGSIKAFAKTMEEFGRVDLLINNAGINPNFGEGPYKSTKDGYERVFQTNVLAPLLTTILLVPLLRKSDDPRILFSGSDTHAQAPSDRVQRAIDNGQSVVAAYNDEETYYNPTRYYESKFLLQMITRSLINSLPDMSIINVNPGLAMTNLGRDFRFGLSFKTAYEIGWFVVNARSASKAARNLTSAAAWKGGSQDYWSECVPTPSENLYMYSGKGVKATSVFYQEMLEEIEKISPGCLGAAKLS